MPPTTAPNSSSSWLIFALLTVISWGLYGVLLHTGRSAMPAGAEMGNASLKAFLWVGVAYFVVLLFHHSYYHHHYYYHHRLVSNG